MPQSKIFFIFCLCFIGSIFIISSIFFKAPSALKSDSVPFMSPVKEKFREVINSNLPNPQSAILAGILLGDKTSFSKEWKQKLSNTGTSHIVAVSGMNIVMLASILVALGASLGLYRKQALLFSLIFVWLFVALVGFQPSVIRAGIMGSVLIVCQLLGRAGASFRVLVMAIALMLAIDPTLLRYNLSFQLSVLATLGLIQLSPVINNKISKFKFFSNKGFREVVSATISAQIFTLPLLIYTFNTVSLVGLLVNILIVPLLSVVMVLGIIFLLGGLVYSPLGVVLAWPVGVLLSLIVWVIDIFSKIPFAVLRL